MSVQLFVRLSEMGVHCDHTVHFGMDLSLWLVGCPNVLGTLTPKHVHLLLAVFPVSPGIEVDMDVQTRHDISRTVEDRG